MKIRYTTYIIVMVILSSCRENESDGLVYYDLSGRIINQFGVGIADVNVFYTNTEFVVTNNEGFYTITNLSGTHVITPNNVNYTFSALSVEVSTTSETLNFTGTKIATEIEAQVFNWFNNQQLSNGLIESIENGNIISLYDNALAAMIYLMDGNILKAENIFDFFNSRIDSELTNGVGGFFQFRNQNGIPNGNRWMGDNAWLLIALNNYKAITGDSKYNNLASEISNWLIDLQDTDGGLFAGYRPDNTLMNYKVTEGNIDAFNAIDGYTNFHQNLLNYLETERWDSNDKNLVSWPENTPYLYALDLHPWSYCIFTNYPISALNSANRFLNTQTAISTGNLVTGYCFDEDKDTVWLEGTGQMALAFKLAYQNNHVDYYLAEMEKALLESPNFSNASGFPYATNIGTTYGNDQLWEGADTNIALSGGAWYLFAQYGFNPFAVGRNKNIPNEDMFWLN